MDFFQVLEDRACKRAFLPREVERELLEKIFHAVRKSPSYMDTQPWEAYVVTGRKKEELQIFKIFKNKNSYTFVMIV